MPVPDIPFLAHNIVWAEIPIIGWVFASIIVMLIVVVRFGWSRGRDVLVRYRLFWGGSFVMVLIMTAVIALSSGEQLPRYL